MVQFKRNIQSEEEKLNKLINEFRKDYGDILDSIFTELNEPESLGYSIELINIVKDYLPPYFDSNDILGYDIRSFGYDNNVISSTGAKTIKKYKTNIKLRNIAHKNLITWKSKAFPDWLLTGISERFKNPFIEYTNFQKLYFLLERLYFLRLGHKLSFEDLLDVYFSGLDENLTFALFKFKINNETLQHIAQFFQKLNKVKHPDKNVAEFEYRSRIIVRTTLSLTYGNYGSFAKIEEEFLSYLAGCNAVKHNRNQIMIDDYLIAYKTYYKLLKTDVTLYKAKPEILKELGLEVTSQNSQDGYLICDNCKGYYKLQPGESPYDFSDKCECGGKLIYKK
ncbi:MAG: hypothetical protein KO318_05130 [Methanobacterium sp.]|jgi:hypothetical protein|nr:MULTISPECIES: hypothetical protein [Methanobacterium]MCC7559798.1 hypothetical protein [Methanobacterium sp.]